MGTKLQSPYDLKINCFFNDVTVATLMLMPLLFIDEPFKLYIYYKKSFVLLRSCQFPYYLKFLKAMTALHDVTPMPELYDFRELEKVAAGLQCKPFSINLFRKELLLWDSKSLIVILLSVILLGVIGTYQ